MVKFSLIVLYSYRDAQVLNPDRGPKVFGKFWVLAVVEEYIRRPLLVFYNIFISRFFKSYTVSLYPLFQVCNNVCVSKLISIFTVELTKPNVKHTKKNEKLSSLNAKTKTCGN